MTHFAIMFHHFFDERHPKGQGAINASEFEAIIDKYGDRILNADEWSKRLRDGTLREEEICITLDDGLLCQYEIALPVMKRKNIKAFWFPYTGVQEGTPNILEIYRYFRTVQFKSIDGFYEAFDEYLKTSAFSSEIAEKLSFFDVKTYLKKWDFYSDADRRFRYIRDQILGPKRYQSAMTGLMEHCNFNAHSVFDDLWMNRTHLKELHDLGHVIGLHSHTHPARIVDLPKSDQRWEYETNIRWLKSNLGITPFAVSYPCGSYDSAALDFLKTHNIRLGFNSCMENKTDHLEISRMDHIYA